MKHMTIKQQLHNVHDKKVSKQNKPNFNLNYLCMELDKLDQSKLIFKSENNIYFSHNECRINLLSWLSVITVMHCSVFASLKTYFNVMKNICKNLFFCDTEVRIVIFWMRTVVNDTVHIKIQIVKLG